MFRILVVLAPVMEKQCGIFLAPDPVTVKNVQACARSVESQTCLWIEIGSVPYCQLPVHPVPEIEIEIYLHFHLACASELFGHHLVTLKLDVLMNE